MDNILVKLLGCFKLHNLAFAVDVNMKFSSFPAFSDPASQNAVSRVPPTLPFHCFGIEVL